MEDPFRIAAEVREALDEGRPVVALETSVVAHGLPPPLNLEAHRPFLLDRVARATDGRSSSANVALLERNAAVAAEIAAVLAEGR